MLLAIFLVPVLAACNSGHVEPGPFGDPARGEALYKQQTIGEAPGCATCHSLQAGQVIVGPSLAAVGLRARNRV